MERNIKIPQGFRFAGMHCGIKKSKKDIALFYCTGKCNAAGTFTRNAFKAAPVLLSKKHIENGEAQAIIANSGVANAATGKKGLEDAKEMAIQTSKTLGIPASEVLVCSTGVIGKKLPMEKINNAIVPLKGLLGNSEKNVLDSAQAIMTTDKYEKVCSESFEGISILGIAKGSGMINPNMATMLCFFFTDASLSKKNLGKALKNAVDKSFNQISVDGCESTNDSVIVLSNSSGKNVSYKNFEKHLTSVAVRLAKLIVADGEGATKTIVARVKGAASKEAARKIAKSVISSNLVKACIHGCDPNVGRIIAAAGSSMNGTKYPGMLVKICDELVFKNGELLEFDEGNLKGKMSAKEIMIKLDMKKGKHNAEAFGCDLTEDYVKFNACYSS